MKFRRNPLFLPFVTLAFALLAPLAGAGAEEIKVIGGTAATAKVKAHKAELEKATGANLTIVPMGVEAVVELVNGRGHVLVGTYNDKALAEALEKAGLGAKANEVMKVATFTDQVAVLVHTGNPVSTLTQEQLKGIFTGKIESWKEVGGPDAFVTVAITRLGKGVQTIFAKEMMDGEGFYKDAMIVDGFQQLIPTIGKTPEAIGHAPLSEVLAEKPATVKVVQCPSVPLTYNVYLLTAAGSNPQVKKVVDAIAALK